MTEQPRYLTDAAGAHRATLGVSPVEDRFEGVIDLGRFPDEFRQLFADYEEIVEGQVLSLLDQVEGRIRSAHFRLVWTDGSTTPVEDLQVFPTTGAISFRAVPPVGVRRNGTAATSHPSSHVA